MCYTIFFKLIGLRHFFTDSGDGSAPHLCLAGMLVTLAGHHGWPLTLANTRAPAKNTLAIAGVPGLVPAPETACS